MSPSLTAKALSSRLDSLRHRGKVGLLAALGAPATPEPDALPRLQGQALAKHHLALALDACQEVDSTKPQAFAKLRLLVNQLEQGRIPKLTTVKVPTMAGAAGQTQNASTPSPSKRSRLLVRAFQGATQIADWRKSLGTTSTDLR